MSQPPSEERRKFVFVFTGPAVDKDGKPRGELMQGMANFAYKILGWKVEMQLDLPLSAQVHVEEASKS